MLRALTRLLLVVGSAALGAAGAIALRADLMVGYGVGKALQTGAAAQPFELAPGPLAQAEVGDEGYWLTRTSLDSHAQVDKGLAVGDRITITGRDGHTRTLQVTDLQSFVGAPLLKVAADNAPVRLVRVTARVIGPADNARGETVRFFLEAAMPKPETASQASLGRT